MVSGRLSRWQFKQRIDWVILSHLNLSYLYLDTLKINKTHGLESVG
ncbi:hypothetical protein cce_1130 [Crocosphaera subtropica ATCC 51142]|uniref:Uncharacterized protein n=1 Tax=Crocosphaera subtropica (strain ATCC 51142 / BH68) TaxID=43989 RepID=B1WUM9_CROS5|nr:hypothetical protein cce_1130 [Crocosphaera subtropica ATCC 51142]